MSPEPSTFFRRDARVVAPELLGWTLRSTIADTEAAGTIVEVEAYVGEGDDASHSRSGPTDRNRVMFGPPGHLYVYFSYGMHWCANVVCGEVGHGEAVLIRALAPTVGLDEMHARRPVARRDRDLCSGPAKLTQALGIDGAHNGLDLLAGHAVVLERSGTADPREVAVSTRIGITRSVEEPWRWYIADDPNVSRR